MRLFYKSCLGIALLILLASCAKQPELDPDQTRIGPPERPRADLVREENPAPLVDGAGFSDDLFNEGLVGRDPNFDILNGDQVRGLFPTIYFDFDQSFVRPADRPALEEVASTLQSNPSDYLLIEGYCDWKGTTEYNLALGDRRATSVMDYLVSLGVDPSRMEILSKGDLEADSDADAAGRALDRKAELVVVRP